MSEQPIWYQYPTGNTPAAAAAADGTGNEQPVWHGFPSAEIPHEAETDAG